MGPRDLDDPGRERRREQRGLLLGGGGCQDRFQILREAHVEHFVRLVEHYEVQGLQPERLPPDVVERSAGRRHHDVDAAAEGADLRTHGCAAVDRQHLHAEHAPVAMDRFGDLHGELAGGHQNEHGRALRRRRIRSQHMQCRQGEGGGLARAGRRLGEEIASGEQRRDRGHLDRRRLFVAEGREAHEEAGIETEGGEAGHGARRCDSRRHPTYHGREGPDTEARRWIDERIRLPQTVVTRARAGASAGDPRLAAAPARVHRDRSSEEPRAE
jgi:hypothetical protein